MTDLTVVVGAQFGSEGKGAISAHLTKDWSRDTGLAIRVAGPNAGHTAYDRIGREWKLRSIPVAAVTGDARLYIAPGSEIDPHVTLAEIQQLDDAGFRVSERLLIHPSVTMIESRHIDTEAATGLVGRVGSTGKGIGAARSARIMRIASTWERFAKSLSMEHLTADLGVLDAPLQWSHHDNVLIEGTQGYGLGLHTEFYPQTTSSDCRAIDFLAMAGISPWHQDTRLTVQLVARVYPIRVAGNSGPLAGETTWEQLGLPEERTTVTNKVRRVGGWDPHLVEDAIHANGGGNWNPDVKLAITMLDQKFPEIAGKRELGDEGVVFINNLENRLATYVNLVGTSPTTVVEL